MFIEVTQLFKGLDDKLATRGIIIPVKNIDVIQEMTLQSADDCERMRDKVRTRIVLEDTTILYVLEDIIVISRALNKKGLM